MVDWVEVRPDDFPPAAGEWGNTGPNCIGIYVSHGGAVRFQTIGGEKPVTVTFPDGHTVPGRVTHVFSTGTTACGIVSQRG